MAANSAIKVSDRFMQHGRDNREATAREPVSRITAPDAAKCLLREIFGLPRGSLILLLP